MYFVSIIRISSVHGTLLLEFPHLSYAISLSHKFPSRTAIVIAQHHCDFCLEFPSSVETGINTCGSGPGRGCQAPTTDGGRKRTAVALPHSLYSVLSRASRNQQLLRVPGQHGRQAESGRQVARVPRPTWPPTVTSQRNWASPLTWRSAASFDTGPT